MIIILRDIYFKCNLAIRHDSQQNLYKGGKTIAYKVIVIKKVWLLFILHQ